MKSKIMFRGAEAEITLYKRKNWIFKDRNKKSYRIPEIDEFLRKRRTKSEARLMDKASKVAFVPKIIRVDEKSSRIVMEFIKGKKLSDNLNDFSEKKQKEILLEAGRNIARLHDLGIIHGDLTTSNMILVEKSKEKLVSKKNKIVNRKNEINNTLSHFKNSDFGWVGGHKSKIFFIDFGLGFHSGKIEDKAVDLHLLKQALEAKHFLRWKILFAKVAEGYKISKNYSEVLERMKKVEQRGRYKEKY